MKSKIFFLTVSFAFAGSVVFADGKRAAEEKKSSPVQVHNCKPNNGTDLKLPKGATYQIHAYDAATDTYTVYSRKFVAEGDSAVTLEGLAKAVKDIRDRKAEIAKKPDDIVDSAFVLEADLPTLFPKEVEARKGCARVH